MNYFRIFCNSTHSIDDNINLKDIHTDIKDLKKSISKVCTDHDELIVQYVKIVKENEQLTTIIKSLNDENRILQQDIDKLQNELTNIIVENFDTIGESDVSYFKTIFIFKKKIFKQFKKNARHLIQDK